MPQQEFPAQDFRTVLQFAPTFCALVTKFLELLYVELDTFSGERMVGGQYQLYTAALDDCTTSNCTCRQH